jgi:UDP-2,3-diacylglucosamine hydrolase
MSRLPRVQDVEPPVPPVVVAGDVHLSPEAPEVTERFLAWLGGLEGRAGTLVLLGDVFDLWVGRPQQHDPVPRRVLPALARLAAAGTRIAFLPGNRDLLFRGVDGVPIDLWRDPVRTRFGDRTVLLTHGDLLCTADRGYQAMRRFLYGPGGHALNRLLPFRGKRCLGRSLRRLSARATRTKARADMDIDYGEALAWMERLGADAIVAGHVHTGVHHRHAGPPARDVLVLLDWERGGAVVVYDAEGLRLEPVTGTAASPGSGAPSSGMPPAAS